MAAAKGAVEVLFDGLRGGGGIGLVVRLIGSEAVDDVAAEVEAGAGVGQVRGFAQEGAQQVERLEMRWRCGLQHDSLHRGVGAQGNVGSDCREEP